MSYFGSRDLYGWLYMLWRCSNYDERVQVKPELTEELKRLEELVKECENAYKEKRKEFYKNRK